MKAWLDILWSRSTSMKLSSAFELVMTTSGPHCSNTAVMLSLQSKSTQHIAYRS